MLVEQNYRYKYINENTVSQAKGIITEKYKEMGYNAEQLDRIARIVTIQEAVSKQQNIIHQKYGLNSYGGGYMMENAPATPQNTIGNDNPSYPQTGVSPSQFHDPTYQRGSGETSYTALQIATQVAATTVGMDVVNTIPIDSPWMMLQYVEPVFGNGTLKGAGVGKSNKPEYIRVEAEEIPREAFRTAVANVARGQWIYFYGSNLAFKGRFMAISTIDNSLIVGVESVGSYDAGFNYTPNDTNTIGDVFANDVDFALPTAASLPTDGNVIDDGASIDLTNATPREVSAISEHIPEFSNFFDGSKNPMTREQTQTGVGNSMGIRMSSKHVDTTSYEVTFQLTRAIMRDMPLEGVDPVAILVKAAQNQIVQSINDLILDRIQQLGVMHAANLKNATGKDNNLYLDIATNSSIAMTSILGADEFVDIRGIDRRADFPAIANSQQLTQSGENSFSVAALLAVSIQKAAQIINVESRVAGGNVAVLNSTMGMALRTILSYQAIKFDNNITTNVTDKLYYMGNLNGIKIYVNPKKYDNVITVGRKGDIGESGVYFMPYVMSDMVTTISEGTFAFRGLLNSTFALADVGWYPEKKYFSYVVHAPNNYILN